METIGRVNQYTCDKCGHTITTVNAAGGVTPMFLRCRKLGAQCDGRMVSSMYRVPEDTSVFPSHVWYKPDERAMRELDEATRDHVRSGGLLLRAANAFDLEKLGWRIRHA